MRAVAGSGAIHLCRQTDCVNPEHMEAVTHTENCRRGRATKLTRAQAVQIRDSKDLGRVVAGRFGVSTATVYAIRSGRLWPDLQGHDELAPKKAA